MSGICGALVAVYATSALVRADEVSLNSCPDAVRETIQSLQKGGEIDEIKKVAIGDRALYLVEIDLRGFRELKLQVRGDGTLQKSIEEIRFQDLPEAVRSAVAPFLVGLSRIDEVEKVFIDEQTQFHIEIKGPQKPDRDLVFDANGSAISQK